MSKQVRAGLTLLLLGACIAAPTACRPRRLGPAETSSPAPTATMPPPLPLPLTPTLPAEDAPGDYTGELVSNGITRTYRLHIPTGYRPDTPLPLLLNLHGFASNPIQQERLSGMSALADQAGFIVVYPQARGTPPAWYVGPGGERSDDLVFLRDLIAHLQGQWSIAPRRIYATGISNGGGMANRLACDLAGTIAAIAPVAGAYLSAEQCDPARPVPVLAFHGTADPLVPYEGSGGILPPVPQWAIGWAQRNGCTAGPTVTFELDEVTARTWSDCEQGAEVVLYTIEGGQHGWPGSNLSLPSLKSTDKVDASALIWEFFLAHPLPEGESVP